MSAKYSIDRYELQKVLDNAMWFLAPLMIVIIPQLQNGATWEEIQSVVYLYLLNISLDFFKKYRSDNPIK